jgi:hypothetical protein
MAATTAAFEAEILALFPNPGSRDRGLMAGAAYKLRQSYLAGMADPAAHSNATNNTAQVDALNRNNEMASFTAIAGP